MSDGDDDNDIHKHTASFCVSQEVDHINFWVSVSDKLAETVATTSAVQNI